MLFLDHSSWGGAAVLNWRWFILFTATSGRNLYLGVIVVINMQYSLNPHVLPESIGGLKEI